MASSLDVAAFLIELADEAGKTLTPMELIKITYIAHGWKLGTRGTPLTDDQAEAWKFGPVYRELYEKVKAYKSAPVRKVDSGNANALPDADRDIVKNVFRHYSQFNGIQLSSMTHKSGTPWSITWDAKGMNSVVSNDLIQSYYADMARDTARESARGEIESHG